MHNICPSDGLANGALGTVIDIRPEGRRGAIWPMSMSFCGGRGAPHTARSSASRVDAVGRAVLSRAQLPCWHSTGCPHWSHDCQRSLSHPQLHVAPVHNSQGLALARAVISLQGTFQMAQGYVALSRCRSLESVTFTSSITSTDLLRAPRQMCAAIYELRRRYHRAAETLEHYTRENVLQDGDDHNLYLSFLPKHCG